MNSNNGNNTPTISVNGISKNVIKSSKKNKISQQIKKFENKKKTVKSKNGSKIKNPKKSGKKNKLRWQFKGKKHNNNTSLN